MTFEARSHEPEMFSLRLSEDLETGRIELTEAELVRTGFTHRLTFTADRAIDTVLDPRLARRIAGLLADTPDPGPAVLSRPEEALILPGLALGRMRVLLSPEEGGRRRNVTVRFRYFIGGIQNAFHADTHFDRPALPDREEVGLRVLEDVALPLLNLATTASTLSVGLGTDTLSQGLKSALKRIEEKAVDLDFHTSLLRRYVQECGPGRIGQLHDFADPVSRVLKAAEPPVPPLRLGRKPLDRPH